MLGVLPIEPSSEYTQSQAYPPTQIIPRLTPSEASIQQASLLQRSIDQSGNGFSHQSSQVEINEQPQSQ
ncbi:9469_t:CDS:2, partial [Paraglomus brasilianum]